MGNMFWYWFTTTFAIIWGRFIAPKASLKLPEPYRFMLEIILFGVSSVALYVVDQKSFCYYSCCVIYNKSHFNHCLETVNLLQYLYKITCHVVLYCILIIQKSSVEN